MPELRVRCSGEVLEAETLDETAGESVSDMWLKVLAQRWPYVLGLGISCVLIVVALNNAVYVIWRSAFPTSNVEAIERVLLLYGLLGIAGLVAAVLCLRGLLRKAGGR